MIPPTKEFVEFEAHRNSIAKQYLEQREYEARKAGKIFVPHLGRDMTPTEYEHYFYNAE